jgi:hypothetical protein
MLQPENSKHGRAADDMLAKESRAGRISNIDEWRELQSDAEESPAQWLLSARPDPGGGINRGSVAARSDLAAALRRTLFPADRARLLAYASQNHLTDNIRDVLEGLPPDIEFRNVEEVWEQHAERPDWIRF